MSSMELVIPAYAKINLSLDVLRKRGDGYHDLQMVMQQLSLCDEVRLCIVEEPGIKLKTDVSYLPVERGNLAWRAAELMGKYAGINLCATGLSIEIRKRIPVAAGLAGGSADAAAVMKGLNQLWRIGFSLEELQVLGVRLGADIPFCLMGGTALAEGIGDRLTPLRLAKPLWVVLVKPAVSVSTREIFKRLVLEQIKIRPDNLMLIESMERADLKSMADSMANVLETVTIPMIPEIGEIKRKMIEYNAAGSLMSGSGPTVFGLFRDGGKARAAASNLSRIYQEVFVTHTVS